MRKAADIAERRSRLSPIKLALLEKRLKGNLKEPSKSSAIEKRPDQNTFTLSFAQERFWFSRAMSDYQYINPNEYKTQLGFIEFKVCICINKIGKLYLFFDDTAEGYING